MKIISLFVLLLSTASIAQNSDDLFKGDSGTTKGPADQVKDKVEAIVPGDAKDQVDAVVPVEIQKSAKQEAQEALPSILDKAVIEADNLIFDREAKILTAEGNVVLGYDGKEVRAQRIEYNQNTRMIKADTGVQFKDENGTVFKAKNIFVTDKFDKGEMRDVTATFKDGSSFYSDNLTINGANQYDLQHSSYSPCQICVGDKHVWELEADKIVYDEAEGRVKYKDTYLKILGHKVAWLPYLSHPTPSAKSKSGFLTPKFGQSSDYGFFAQVPYYWQPKQNMDFTFTPMLTQHDGIILINEFRHLTEAGEYKFNFSGANPREVDEFGNPVPGGGNKFRGHIQGIGTFHYGDNWNYGFDFARVTDDTYLSRYKIGAFDDVLKSELYADRLKGRDFFSIKALAFQGLRATDDPAISPVVAPLIDAGKTFHVSDEFNQRIETNVNTMFLKRDVGADSSRVIGSGAWKADYTTTGGHIFKANLGTRADYYDVNKVPFMSTQFNGSVDRIMPTASLTWSLPMQKYGEAYGLVLEPIVMAAASPNGNNSLKIPNEDSQNIELYDYNLFQEEHISGYDLVEDGFRTNYGVRGMLTTNELGDYNFLFGQNYRAQTDPAIFAPDSGLDDNFSDYVGRIVTGSPKVQSSYRFRLDKDNFSFNRNEVGLNLNLEPISVASTYTFINGLNTTPDRQEVAAATRIKVTDNVALLTSARRNLDNDASAGWVNIGGGVEYNNDCLRSTFEVNREFTRDRDIEPSTEFIFKVSLINLGS